MIELNSIYNECCLEGMQRLPNKSIDMVLCDMPYGTTSCKWDTVLDLEKMWKELKRIVRNNTAVVLTASQPFTTVLINSNFNIFKYTLVWDKVFSGNFVQAARRPLCTHEDILIFCFEKTLPKYNPQKTIRDVPIKKGGNKQSEAIPIATTIKAKEFGNSKKLYIDKNPISILKYSKRQDKRGLHPTQKPIALMEYLIKTYTNEGDTILDFCMGSGTTAIAAINTNRNFIGFEKEAKYHEIATNRIKEVQDGGVTPAKRRTTLSS